MAVDSATAFSEGPANANEGTPGQQEGSQYAPGKGALAGFRAKAAATNDGKDPYADLSDQALAEGMHRRYYSDIPFDEFAQKIGFSPTAKDIARPSSVPDEQPLTRTQRIMQKAHEVAGAATDPQFWSDVGSNLKTMGREVLDNTKEGGTFGDLWRDRDAISTTVGGRIEKKIVGTQEYINEEKKRQALLEQTKAAALPGIIADAKRKGINVWDHPDLIALAERNNMQPMAFAADSALYADPAEAQKRYGEARKNLIDANDSLEELSQRRSKANEIIADARPKDMGSDFSARALMFDAATSIPDLLATAGAATATGGAGGIAVLAGTVAPEFYSDAKSQGAKHETATTYATLMTLAEAAPELPFAEAIANTPAGRKIMQKLVGNAVKTTGGRVAGEAALEGASEGVTSLLQSAIDAGVLDKNITLKDALLGAAHDTIVGAGMGGAVAAPIEGVRGHHAEPNVNVGPTPEEFAQTEEMARNAAPPLKEPPTLSGPRGQADFEVPHAAESPALPAPKYGSEPTGQVDLAEPARPRGVTSEGTPQGFAVGTEGAAREYSEQQADEIAARRDSQQATRTELGSDNITRVPRSQEVGPVENEPAEVPKSAAARRQMYMEKVETVHDAISEIVNPKDVTVRKDGDRYTIFVRQKPSASFASETLAREMLTDVRQEIVARRAGTPESENKTKVLGQEVSAPALPTPAQAEAGNYRKPLVKWNGIDIKVENVKDSTRSGIDESGKPWSQVMKSDYGYFKGTKSNDGEGVDVFMGPHRGVKTAYVIDQLTPDGLKFDEPKVVIGANGEETAKALYLKHYPKGWKGLGSITPVPVEGLKAWLRSGNTQSPISWQPPTVKRGTTARSTRVPQVNHDSILEYLSKKTLHGADSAGLNIAALAREGLDQKEMANSLGHGINRAFTKNGGSLDHAAEILTEAGYPVGGDKNKLLDLITKELRQGKKTYSENRSFEDLDSELRSKYEDANVDDEEIAALEARVEHLAKTLEDKKSEYKGQKLKKLNPDDSHVKITHEDRVEDQRHAYKDQMVLPFEREQTKAIDDIETRPDTNANQVKAGREALRSLVAIRDVRAGARVLASGIPKDFIHHGTTSLLGKAVKSSDDLAELAQVYRDPRFETLRVFFVRNNEVVHQTGISSRLPGAVQFRFAKENSWSASMSALQQMMLKSKADGFYMLHNHPSGSPNPSIADELVTSRTAESIKGFLGHVVIDNNAYSVISIENGETKVVTRAHRFGGYETGKKPEIDHPAMRSGMSIRSPKALAILAKTIESSPGVVTIIGVTGTDSRVRAIAQYPASMLNGDLRSIARIRKLAINSGSRNLFAVTDDLSPVRVLADKGLFTDTLVRTSDGRYRSYEETGVEDSGNVPSGNRSAVAENLGRLTPKTVRVEEDRGEYDHGQKESSIVREPTPEYQGGATEQAKVPKGHEDARANKYYEAARRAVVTLTANNEVVLSFRRLIDPVNISPLSKVTARVTRAALGNLAAEKQRTLDTLEHYSATLDRMSPTDQLSVIDDIENGRPQSVKGMQPMANELRGLLDKWKEKIQSLGDGYLENYIENYFPHYWQDEGRAARLVGQIEGRRPLRGPGTFLKKRKIPTVKEGIAFGLKPLSVNPLVLTALKLHEMQKFYTGVKLMQEFKDAGLAKFLPASKPMPTGWAEIKDAVGRVRQWSEAEGGFVERGRYVMPEDAARIINNHLSASALRNFLPAQIFRTASNALNALQLGFSAFHLGFTTLDAVISKNAIGIERLAHGEPLRAAAAFLEGATGPVAAVANLARGYKLLRAYSNVSGATPEMQALVKMLQFGGGRVKMDRYFMAAQGASPFHGVGVYSLAKDVKAALSQPRDKVATLTKVATDFPVAYAQKMWNDLHAMTKTFPIWSLPFEIAGRVTRASSAIIMEHIVPLQKLGVFADLASDYLRRNPTAPPIKAMEEMQKAWDSVDNRLGEMVYDNRFWNRTFKDSLHFMIRAVGWNYGTVSEIGGAPIDTLRMIDKAVRGDVKKYDFTHKMAYVLAMTATTMLFGAILQKLLTGKEPEEPKDYFFPRSGGTTKYGTPQRVSLPSYAKDVYEYAHEPGQTMLNKLNPIFSTLSDIWSNEDFFGNAIYDPEGTRLEKSGQIAAFVGKEATPFSLQGAQHIQGSGEEGVGGKAKSILPFIGITPAPGRVTSTEEMETARTARKESSYAQGLKFKMNQAQQAGDQVKVKDLQEKYAAARKRAAELQRQNKINKAKGSAAQNQDREVDKAKLVDKIGALIDGNGKDDVVRSIRDAGHPALAALFADMPAKPRPTVAKALQQVPIGGAV